MNQLRHAVTRVIDIWGYGWQEFRPSRLRFVLAGVPLLLLATPAVFVRAVFDRVEP